MSCCSDRHISVYRLTQAALYQDTVSLRPPYIGMPSHSDHPTGGSPLHPPYIGIPPYSDRLVSGYRLTQTAVYRYTALLAPPFVGIPPYWGTPALLHDLMVSACCSRVLHACVTGAFSVVRTHKLPKQPGLFMCPSVRKYWQSLYINIEIKWCLYFRTGWSRLRCHRRLSGLFPPSQTSRRG